MHKDEWREKRERLLKTIFLFYFRFERRNSMVVNCCNVYISVCILAYLKLVPLWNCKKFVVKLDSINIIIYIS